MLEYFFNPVISIHDGLTLIFSQYLMLAYLYGIMIYTHTWCTTKRPNRRYPKTVFTYRFIYDNLVMSVYTGVAVEMKC